MEEEAGGIDRTTKDGWKIVLGPFDHFPRASIRDSKLIEVFKKEIDETPGSFATYERVVYEPANSFRIFQGSDILEFKPEDMDLEAYKSSYLVGIK